MHRPLFVVCLCLVTIAAVRLWLYDAFDPGGGWRVSSVYPDGEVVTVIGRVHQKDTQSFLLSDVADLQQNIPLNNKIICEYAKAPMPHIGARVIVQGSFRNFSQATNPGEFDVAEYYATLEIDGKLTDARVLEESATYSRWRETLYELREYFKCRLYKVFPQKEASVLVAMLLGDKTELDKGIKDLYKENGIIHILSISGLHITLIGLSIYQMLRQLGVPVWMAAICGGSILCLYGVMTGLSVSACRAIGMYLLRLLADIVGRTYDMLTALGVLAVIMIWQNPMNLRNAGFLLSFGSVLGIGWFYPAIVPKEKKVVRQMYQPKKWRRILYKLMREWNKRLVQSILASASITLFTLPIQLWFYYEVPVYSLFVNLLILPFMSLVMMTGIVVMILPGSGIIGTVTGLILQGYEWLCECFGVLPFHTWNPGKPEIWQVVLYYIILLLMAFWREKKEGLIYWVSRKTFLLTVLVIVISMQIHRGTRVTFLDVGQGDCIVVETDSEEVFLFDCGSTSRNNIGEYILLPFLKSKGIRHIDAVFVSHPDKDHCSGIEELFTFSEEEEIHIGQLVLPAIEQGRRKEEMFSLLEMAHQAEVKVAYIGAGDSFSTKGVSFLCLHPPQSYECDDSNAYSQCIYAKIGRRDEENQVYTLLLTGDVEAAGEEHFLQEVKKRDISNITILKVAHHGSRYSSSTDFLNTVKPKLAIISCGRNNTYGHPHKETLDRLEEVESKVLTTPESGAIIIELEKEIKVRRWRVNG